MAVSSTKKEQQQRPASTAETPPSSDRQEEKKQNDNLDISSMVASIQKEIQRAKSEDNDDDDDSAASPVSLSSNEEDHADNNSNSTPKSSMPSTSIFPSDEKKEKKNGLKKSTTCRSPQKSRWGSICGTFLRTLLLDFPLLSLFSLLTIVILVEKAQHDYLIPQLKLVEWMNHDDNPREDQEITYFRRTCTIDDVSTHDAADLYLDPSTDTVDTAVEKMSIHGASIYPQVLSEQTAREVRDFILEQNLKGQDMIYVIENKQRWSFGIQVDQHPSIAKALTEILSQKFLVDALEAIVGENPAVIEFTGITSAYGAAEQGMHQDVIPDGSGAQFARNFVPSYSLFIPLQNTTRKMGATQVCPGTQMCATGANPVCEEYGYPVSGAQDNWPAGYGALVSQQTTHRGPAHMDPNGEERVLFILTFAPRPRHGKHQVETRILGNGGSYSLHWSQWGHALRDYVNVERNMMFPWRHLRSLGLYKPSNAQWGWDYLATSSQRIMHEELGFNADNFWETVDKLKKGNEQWWFFPKVLWPWHAMKRNRMGMVRGPQLWVEFLRATLENYVDFFKYWYPRALAAYAATMLVLHVVLVMTTRRRGLWKDFTILRMASRLIFWHAVIASLGWLYYYRHVGQGTWARNIRMGLHAHTPTENLYNPVLPCTLPTNDDVLDLRDYQSNYLASFANVLDYNHPGNAKWQGMIGGYGARGYQQLAPALQGKLCSSLATWSKQYNKARLLTKNNLNQWSEMTPALADRFCHSQLLRSRRRPSSTTTTTTIARVITWVDFLISETRFGYWRETALHNYHMQDFLHALQNKLMHYDATQRAKFRHGDGRRPRVWADSSNKNATATTANVARPLFSTKSTTTAITNLSPNATRRPQRNALPPQPAIEPPNPSAWLQEGDIVEGQYNSQFDEFYRGRIDFANAFRRTWDVQYDDGEWDMGLCSKCVRPFVPYHVGEELEWRDEKENFFKCQVVKVHKDGKDIEYEELKDSVDIKLLASGKILKYVLPMQLRRKLSDVDRSQFLKPGADIQAMFPDDPDDILYPGRIREYLGDGIYVIDFEDGDVADVPVSDIQPLMM